MSHNPDTIKPKFSNGTELEFWLEHCNGCSRNKWNKNWCNLQTAVMTGFLTLRQAKSIGFDEQGNPPRELKCWRKYTHKHIDRKTGDLFNESQF